jgi:hypothetical protein
VWSVCGGEEDSGWYTVHYSAADQLVWGRGQGCYFVDKPCTAWDADLGCEEVCGVCGGDYSGWYSVTEW